MLVELIRSHLKTEKPEPTLEDLQRLAEFVTWDASFDNVSYLKGVHLYMQKEGFEALAREYKKAGREVRWPVDKSLVTDVYAHDDDAYRGFGIAMPGSEVYARHDRLQEIRKAEAAAGKVKSKVKHYDLEPETFRRFTYRGEGSSYSGRGGKQFDDVRELFTELVDQDGVGIRNKTGKEQRVVDSCHVTPFPDTALNYCYPYGTGIWLLKPLDVNRNEEELHQLIPMRGVAFFLTSEDGAEKLYREFGSSDRSIFGRPLEQVVLPVEGSPPIWRDYTSQEIHREVSKMMGRIMELNLAN